jgi:hypothetical protein
MTTGPARSHGFDTWVEELFGRLEIMLRNSFDELACASELHRPNLTSSDIRAHWPIRAFV